MLTKKILYRLLFSVFLFSILLVFYVIRPFNSPWHRFLAGDGLGYYSYLPASFIYHDRQFDFSWFNAVYEKHYISNAGSSADDNFLVNFHGKRVNKYYPGLSFLWLPFFLLAHACAYVFQFPGDGYSLPYQWAIGLASLFYLFLGLFYLRKLLFRLFEKAWIALLVPMVIFYGTYLFDYALNQNSLSHVYSFCMIVLFVYHVQRYFTEEENKLLHFLWSIFIFLLIIFIRPLNVIVLLLVPAIATSFKLPDRKHLGKFTWTQVLLCLLIVWVFVRQFSILFLSTGAILPNTYEGEYFDFLHARFWQVTFSYQAGLFVYAPVLLVSFLGIPYLENTKQKILFPAVLVALIILYSAWWFWPITSRALIDYYVIPAILLAAWLGKFSGKKAAMYSMLFFLVLLSLYHQLKSLQFRRGILDENYTHKELFWRNFFSIRPAHLYAVPPESIREQYVGKESFEDYKGKREEHYATDGKYSAVLDAASEYTRPFVCKVPEFLYRSGIPKVRVSFDLMPGEEASSLQIYLNFCSKDDRVLLSLPFYLKEHDFYKNEWTRVEFGYEFSAEQLKALQPDYLNVFLWNPERKNTISVDQLKTEFFLCDRSYEILP